MSLNNYDMNEYRIEIKVKNNIIVKKIENAGYKTIGEFCRLNNLLSQASRLGDIVNMKSSPLRSDGDWQKIIIKVSDILGCDPQDLFTDVQINTILRSNKRNIEVKEAEMKFILDQSNQHKLLEQVIHDEERNKTIDDVLNTLTPREKKILEMRMGMGEFSDILTLEEVGREFGINRERVRQIECKALRKLRHPSRCDVLREFLE